MELNQTESNLPTDEQEIFGRYSKKAQESQRQAAIAAGASLGKSDAGASIHQQERRDVAVTAGAPLEFIRLASYRLSTADLYQMLNDQKKARGTTYTPVSVTADCKCYYVGVRGKVNEGEQEILEGCLGPYRRSMCDLQYWERLDLNDEDTIARLEQEKRDLDRFRDAMTRFE